ncbi:hypothetical protein KUTeg_021426 [Tegillarca granosa]|uniref:Uncharacterized protein n=1 Tax=Tegillarca granosa TaxID=220873 RepID=A0ABQ9E8L4_TEGGR|nr:hypothetical protein KUTeg_021426 [Tegillarca granosa]
MPTFIPSNNILQEKRRRRHQRKRQREKEAERRRNCRLEPIQKQRTHILIIKADESDEEKRERDVTQQMSEMSMDIDMACDTNRDSVGTNETSEMEETDKQNNNNTSCDKDDVKSIISEEEEYEIDYSRWKEECCLKQLYPAIYEEEYEHLRILERVAALFIFCLGVRGTQRIGPTGFRTFARYCVNVFLFLIRRCRLNRKGITNAAIDILYIDLQRRWDHMNPERTSGIYIFISGLCFQGFLDACIEIARRRFYADLKYEMLNNLWTIVRPI